MSSVSPRRCARTAAALLLVGAALLPARGAAQVRPDSVVQVRPDTAGAAGRAAPDSLGGAAQAVPDSLAADTIFYNLPELEGEAPAGWTRGVWEWNAEDILSSGSNTLVELLDAVPGMVPLRGGDYGTPLALSAFGAAGGGVRIYRDGFEVLPLSGSVPDLMKVGLGGIRRVRLERNMGGLVIHLYSYRYDDGRPYSLIEAGTGDLNTNVFRGTFADATSLGGSVALALERNDTRGPRGEEPGSRTGSWLRYQLHRGNDAGVALEFRRMGSETEVPHYASPATRTDWSLRGRARLAPGLTGEAYWGRSTYAVEDVRPEYAREGGTRSQLGVRLAWQPTPLVWARGSYRRFSGDDLPGDRLRLSGGFQLPRLAGGSVEVDRAGWRETPTRMQRVRGWTEPFFGLSLFASREWGTRGARMNPLLDVVPPPDTTDGGGGGEGGAAEGAAGDTASFAPPEPLFRTVEGTYTRYGGQWAWRGVVLSGARLTMDVDSLLPLALEMDRGEPALPGGVRKGWEAYGRLPLPFWDGFHVEGSLQRWDEAWRYLPEQIYRAAFVYHNTFLESGNFEMWWTLGVRGRKPMAVHRVTGTVEDEETGGARPELAQVPFYQNWYGSIQLRIVTVRIFVGWENFTIRRNLQDFPGRVLPRTRAMYGLRWTMWN